MTKLPLHIKMFNDKVKLMNQSKQRDLTLSAQDAQNLHADIFDLLNHCAALSQEIIKKQDSNAIVEVKMDGGSFK